jgi:hypothetical protein
MGPDAPGSLIKMDRRVPHFDLAPRASTVGLLFRPQTEDTAVPIIDDV